MVKISEKMLEDWICEHPESLGERIIILGRQIPLKHGILDVLAWDDVLKSILIIELKATSIREAHIGQVLRYSSDIGVLLVEFWHAHLHKLDEEELLPRQELYAEALQSYLLGRDDFLLTPRLCVLIGTSIDEKTEAAADGGQIQVRLWSLDHSGRISIGRPVDTTDYEEKIIVPDWIYRLWPHIDRTCQQVANFRFQEQLEKLFEKES